MTASKRAVLALIERGVGVDVADIVRQLGLTYPAAARHVRALLGQGLIAWHGAALAVTNRGRERLTYWRQGDAPAKQITFG